VRKVEIAFPSTATKSWNQDPNNVSIMKRNLSIIALALGIAIVGIGVFLSQGSLRGERKTDFGRVYYFADGFIAKDTSRATAEFYVVEIDPKSIRRADLDGDGIVIHLKRNAPKELVTNIASTGRPESGHVVTCQKFSNGYAWRNLELDTSSIETFIASQNWDDSIRIVLGE